MGTRNLMNCPTVPHTVLVSELVSWRKVAVIFEPLDFWRVAKCGSFRSAATDLRRRPQGHENLL